MILSAGSQVAQEDCSPENAQICSVWMPGEFGLEDLQEICESLKRHNLDIPCWGLLSPKCTRYK